MLVKLSLPRTLICTLLASATGMPPALAAGNPELELLLDSQSRVLEKLELRQPGSECSTCAPAERPKTAACECRQFSADKAGAPVEVDVKDELGQAKLLWLNEKLHLEQQDRKSLRLSLLKEAEEMEKYSLYGKESRELIHRWAASLKELADAPDLKKQLLDAHESYNPDLLLADPGKKDSAWRWEKFGTKDYIRLGVLGAATIGGEALSARTSKPRWQGGILLDNEIKDAIALTGETRGRWQDAGNLVTMGLVAWPFVDTLGVAGGIKRDKDAALQGTLVSLESFAFTAAVYGTAKGLFARKRPGAELTPDGECAKGADCHSFPSGHTAFVFTAASLTCTHHSYLQLYGNSTADQSACIAAMALASFTGLTRIMANKHYTSDVAVGAALGLFSGLVLPRILHYRPDKEKKSAIPFEVNVTPVALEQGGGLMCTIPF